MYPGIFDLSCWEIGRSWCRPNKIICEECYLNDYCIKKP
jgi:endonuclease III